MMLHLVLSVSFGQNMGQQQHLGKLYRHKGHMLLLREDQV